MTTNNQRSCCEGQKRITEARDAAAEKRASEPSSDEPQMCIIPEHPDNCIIHGKKQPSACPKCGYKSCLDLSSPSLQQPVKAQQPSVIRRNPNEDHRAAQPSADFSKSGMSAGGIQTWREASETEQPGAPTADMEKIARELNLSVARTYDAAYPSAIAEATITEGIAQVCAPLVELETKWQERINRYKDKKSHAKGTDIPNQGGKIKATIECLQDLRAALIGTRRETKTNFF